MRARVLGTICLSAILCACESLPSLPPPGPVTTADQAIRIAINKCTPTSDFDYGTRDVAGWNAQRQNDQWHLRFLGSHRSGATLELLVEIRPEDGEVLSCLDYEMLHIPT